MYTLTIQVNDLIAMDFPEVSSYDEMLSQLNSFGVGCDYSYRTSDGKQYSFPRSAQTIC